MGRSSNVKVEVRADGTGLSSRAGTALLPLAAERLGLTDALGWALGETRERRSAHDPGRGFCDLAGMLADGGRWVSGLVAVGAQAALFGGVASVSAPRRGGFVGRGGGGGGRCGGAGGRSRRGGGCCWGWGRRSLTAGARRAPRRGGGGGRRAPRQGR